MKSRVAAHETRFKRSRPGNGGGPDTCSRDVKLWVAAPGLNLVKALSESEHGEVQVGNRTQAEETKWRRGYRFKGFGRPRQRWMAKQRFQVLMEIKACNNMRRLESANQTHLSECEHLKVVA